MSSGNADELPGGAFASTERSKARRFLMGTPTFWLAVTLGVLGERVQDPGPLGLTFAALPLVLVIGSLILQRSRPQGSEKALTPRNLRRIARLAEVPELGTVKRCRWPDSGSETARWAATHSATGASGGRTSPPRARDTSRPVRIPADPEVQATVRHWTYLMKDVTGGDRAILSGTYGKMDSKGLEVTTGTWSAPRHGTTSRGRSRSGLTPGPDVCTLSRQGSPWGVISNWPSQRLGDTPPTQWRSTGKFRKNVSVVFLACRCHGSPGQV